MRELSGNVLHFCEQGRKLNPQYRAKPFGNEPLGSARTPQRSREKSTPVCAGCDPASGDTAGQLGGVMFRFRYKGSEKMRARRFVGPVADAVIFIRSLQ